MVQRRQAPTTDDVFDGVNNSYEMKIRDGKRVDRRIEKTSQNATIIRLTCRAVN